MKKLNLTILLTVLLSLVGTKAFAHDIEVQNADGVTIYYIWTNDNTELAVSYQGDFYHSFSDEYAGNVVIPEIVTYNGATYSVTSIVNQAFRGCSSLISVTIGNNVTSIGNQAFYECSSLTSVIIPNSVTFIGSYAFCLCSSLTSVEIPNGITTIGGYAFNGCSSLTSVTIPNSVTSIGQNAFCCGNLVEVVSLIENPFAISGKSSSGRTFSLNTFNNATLYVPVGTKEKYKATEGWVDFQSIEEGTGSGGKKCATPTISFVNGELEFSCETEDVEYEYEVTVADAKKDKGSKVSLKGAYKVSVYATKEGYENSDVATLEFTMSDTGLKGDVNGDGVVDVSDYIGVANFILFGNFEGK